MKQPFVLVVALLIALSVSGCEKLPAPQAAIAAIPLKATGTVNAIPLGYGDLVGVAPAELPGWAVLFFQRPDKSIVTIYVNTERGVIGNEVLDIPRR